MILRIFIALVVIIVLLRIFGIDITDVLNQPWVTDFFLWIKKMTRIVWADLITIFEYFKAT